VALACGWSSLWFFVWSVGFWSLVGFWIGFGLAVFLLPLLTILASTLGFAAFGLFYACLGTIAMAMSSIFSMWVGRAFARVVTRRMIRHEPLLMKLRGYRVLSDRERNRVAQIIEDVSAALEVTALPIFLVHDSRAPGAWTHSRHVVFTKRSLDSDERHFAALLAHELHHFRSRDPVHATFVWACALPVAFFAGLQRLVRMRGGKFLGMVVALMFWPAMILLRFVIAPVCGEDNRRREYAADAAATDAGYGDSLIELLDSVRALEPGRTNWDSVMAATHPPIELRIQEIERRLAASNIVVQTEAS
jgi:Zn-dependent protease with chaperone function